MDESSPLVTSDAKLKYSSIPVIPGVLPKEAPRRCCFPWRMRSTMLILTFMSNLICYIDRTNLSIAIIPMAAEHNWSKSYQGIVHSSFFYGYLLTQILGGYLADRFGGKAILAAGVIWWSIMTALTPVVVSVTALLMVVRIGMGIGEGVNFPACLNLLSRWLPLDERSTGMGFVKSGMYCGSILALILSPVIINHMSWHWCFYLFGMTGVLWFVVFVWLGSSTPQSNRYISEQEKAYILAHVTTSRNASQIPLLKILTSPAVWAIALAWFCNNWGWYTWLSWQPSFYKELGVSTDTASWLSALPYVVMMLMVIIAGTISDYLIGRGIDVAFVRKTCNGIGMIGPAVCYAFLPAVKSAEVAVTIISTAFAFNAFAVMGYGVNSIDIGNTYAGTVTGVGNTVGCLAGVVSNLYAGYQIERTGNWGIVLYTMCGTYVLGTIIFAILAKGTPQFEGDDVVYSHVPSKLPPDTDSVEPVSRKTS
eukprot:GILK01004934.1.p1 GENE.GILK01004934.1~~GILK01004934.1.p1  ORF type:complete len:508 (+),score=17.74 GILK01004934.1:90-1526(+)